MLKIPPPKGQTFVEALATLLFVSIAVIALIRFQNYLAYDNSFAQQKAEALILATKQIETLRNFQVLNNITGYTSYQSIASGSATSTEKTTIYTINTIVSTFTNPTYKNVTVTVSWTDRNNQSQSVQVITMIAAIDPASTTSVI